MAGSLRTCGRMNGMTPVPEWMVEEARESMLGG